MGCSQLSSLSSLQEVKNDIALRAWNWAIASTQAMLASEHGIVLSGAHELVSECHSKSLSPEVFCIQSSDAAQATPRPVNKLLTHYWQLHLAVSLVTDGS